MDRNWIALMDLENQVAEVMETNQTAARYGLILSEEEARLILQERISVLKTQRRVEFGGGITARLLYEFCDSEYIDQNNYVETVIRLQEIFYLYKNEMNDEITDDELLHLMKEQFENICFGDLEYLEGTGLSHFARAVRAGYGGYKGVDGRGEYSRFEEVKRWDHELYMEALRDLCWE